MAVFTSSKEELNITCSGRLDSKGRITVPSRIRDGLGLEKGDEVSLTLSAVRTVRKDFSSKKKALKFLSQLEGVKSFSFNGESLEVMIRE